MAFWAAPAYSLGMPEKKMNQIPRDLRELFQKGMAALQRQNYDYAIAIFNQVLTREPGFFDCRQSLRATQFKKAGGGTTFFKKMFGGANPNLAKAKLVMQKDPAEAMAVLEQVLNSDPPNTGAHKMMADAALAAGFPLTACLSLEILLKGSNKDFDLAMQYGAALRASGQIEKAETVYTDLARQYPNKGEVTQALKDLSAKRTLQEGGYDALSDGSGSYRDILKNKEEAIALEQEKREVKTEDVANRLIQEYETRLATEPGNVKLMRNVAELYAQKQDFNRSLEYYEKIRSTASGADASLEKAIAETTLRKFDYEVEQLDPNAPDYDAQVAQLQAQRTEFQLRECQARAEKYPTDLQIRFELGRLLFDAGKISDAIQELQKAQANPQRRLQAMSLLAQCFAKRGMNDMAARKFQEALKEKLVFDEEKKELIYNLGCVYQKTGKAEEAIEQFKQIYEVDIGYKDVGAKVDAYYSSQG